MRKMILASLILAMAAAAGGCGNQYVGQREPLGAVSYETAFEAAKTVLESKKFTIVKADEGTGTIVGKSGITDVQTRLVSKSPTRETATVRIQRSGGGQLVAYVTVTMEEKVTIPASMMPGAGTYSGAPSDTPIDHGAALSREQQDEWRNGGADVSMQQRILASLRRACQTK